MNEVITLKQKKISEINDIPPPNPPPLTSPPAPPTSPSLPHHFVHIMTHFTVGYNQDTHKAVLCELLRK